MSNHDGTGPEGKGTETGRGLGNCNDKQTKRKPGKFFFRRRGLGNGRSKILRGNNKE